MTTDNSKSNIYPEYCHELSPSIKKWCPLRAVDIRGLAEYGLYNNGRRLYHHGNHPIKWVRITGLIVAIDDFVTRRIFTVDDSSGACIECVCPAPPTTIDPSITPTIPNSAVLVTKKTDSKKEQRTGPSVTNPTIPWDDMDVGAVVKIKGGITTFRDEKKVEIIKVEVLRSTDQEVRCWNEVLEFRREVLGVEWIVSKEMEERCRKRALKEASRKRKDAASKRAGGALDMKLERAKEVNGKAKTKEHRQNERPKEVEEARQVRKDRERRERHEQKPRYQKAAMVTS